MLTIHSGINRNVNLGTTFGNRIRPERQDREYDYQMSEMDMITQEYNEERASWVEQKRNFEEMIQDKEAQLPKPIKTVMKGGAVLAAGVLGGMATGYSAKYIMNSFQKMANSKQAKKVGNKFTEYISKPVKKGFGIAKAFVEKQIAKVKSSKLFTKNKAKAEKQVDKFTNSKFVKSIKDFGNKVANNSIVKATTGFVDKVFSKFADGVVSIYNKLAKVNYKNATADALGVAGGVSTGAVTLMEGCEPEKATDIANDFDAEI